MKFVKNFKELEKLSRNGKIRLPYDYKIHEYPAYVKHHEYDAMGSYDEWFTFEEVPAEELKEKRELEIRTAILEARKQILDLEDEIARLESELKKLD